MHTTDNSPTKKDMLEGMEAYLDSLDGDPDIALNKIAGKSDPDNIRRRITILIDSGRIERAAEEVRSHDKAEAWIDLAIYSFAAIGADDDAKAYLDWAKELPQTVMWQRSSIGYYDGTFVWTFRNRAEGEGILPGSLNTAEHKYIKNASEIVKAACASSLVFGRPATELDVELLSRLFDASYILADRESCRKIVRVLEKRIPIPLKIAQAVLQDIADPVSNIINRLWSEHGESFMARYLSCMIQAKELGNEEIALDRAYQLVDFAKSNDDKEKLCQLLYGLTNPDDSVALAKVMGTATALLGKGSNQLKLMGADDSLRKGDEANALAMLETFDIASDPQALRIKALAKLKGGEPLEGLKLLQELSKVTPSPWVFKLISDVASKHDRENDEQEALEHLLVLAPSELNARRRLSSLYGRQDDYKRATLHLEILRRQTPEDVDVMVNLAISYWFDGQPDRALAVLDETDISKVERFPIVKTRSQFLHALGRTQDAFRVLDEVRGEYWDDPEFLSSYMTVCHAAAEDLKAHEALTKLIELKNKGLIDDHIIHEASLDDLKEMLIGAKKRSEDVKKFIVEGKFPWLMGAEMDRDAMYWSWSLRTQPLKWLFDDPINRASYSIYSTNGFRVLHSQNDSPTLEAIQCASRGESIVADASALITLHSLGLLGKAADYFGRVLVPASYLPKIIADLRKMFPHQLSQKMAAEQIRASVESKSITVQSMALSGQQIEVLDEYQDENESSDLTYRISDLLEILHSKGLVTDAQRDRAKSVAHTAPVADQKQVPLKIGQPICVREATLVTLAGIGWLDLVTKQFSVHITRQDFDDVMSRIRAFQTLDTSQRLHKELWNLIQTSKHFEFVPVTKDLTIPEEDKIDRDVAIASYLVAKERNLPLLVDDRVCQTLLMNEWNTSPVAAFGSDLLVLDMAKSGALTHDEAADALLRLIAWRYRFILVPPEILKLLADRYRGHPPGSALRQVAIYVHDCMRDEGMFGGLEPTNPPVSIAVRQYQSWVQNIAEFIMDIWLDDTIDEISAQEITIWAITEFLPSPPRVADDRLQSTIASLTPRTFITRALIRSINGRDFERINRALRMMSSTLGLEETEYLKIVAGVVNGI